MNWVLCNRETTFIITKMSFLDKVVVITGASAGIGAASAVQFAKQGAKLVLTGRNQSRMEKVVQECINAGSSKEKTEVVYGDIREQSHLEEVAKVALHRFGKVNVLVNNAGYSIPGDADSATLEDMDQMYNIHIRAPFYLTKLLLSSLKEHKGAVVNVSSAAGVIAVPDRLCYGAAKAGLIHMSKIFAHDLVGDGVRINSISPGYIKTRVIQSRYEREGKVLSDEDNQKVLKTWDSIVPIGHLGESDEVANLIVFLASDAASYITGQDVTIDGGLLLKPKFGLSSGTGFVQQPGSDAK